MPRPTIVSLPALPGDVAGRAHLMTTPRARVILGPRIYDPRVLVERSGRMGCIFSLRSVATGIIEFLFPGGGFLRRDDPLFRLYDPGVLADLAAAERALANYDVKPLLIAPSSRRLRTGRRTAGSRSRQDDPQRPDPPITGQGSSRSPRMERPASAGTSQRPAAVQPQTAKPSTSVRVARRPAPAPQPIAPPPAPVQKVDLTPYQETLAEAEANLNKKHGELTLRQEDYDAKQRLHELGAISQDAVTESAAKLADAMMRRADAEARLATARTQLELQQKKNGQATRTAPAAPEPVSEPEGVEVVLGGDVQPKVASLPQSRPLGDVEAGVEVIRGLASHKPPPTAATPKPSAGDGPARTTPAPGARRNVPRPSTPRATAPVTRPPRQRRHSDTGPLVSRRLLPKPRELDRLSEKRWTDYHAPADGFVLECSTSDGAAIEAGQELLRVINTQWAVSYIPVRPRDAAKFSPGTMVMVTFDDYPQVAFEGWVNSLAAQEETQRLRAELVVFCTSGYYGTDAFATLQWLALATPLGQHHEVAPMAPMVVGRPESLYRTDPLAMLSMVPQDVWAQSVSDEELRRSATVYEGQLELLELTGGEQTPQSTGSARQRLARLRRWREDFADGMIRTAFGRDTILTYPASGEIRRAIERMATGSVSNIPNMCARTMREALGWGLGDAHLWARLLPGRGYAARGDGLARPGDILVWPFTFPPRNTQHIGIAVQQDGKLMLLSNLAGRLGTGEISPGYVAFYKPTT